METASIDIHLKDATREAAEGKSTVKRGHN
jgi:hypothetical protein